MVNGVTFNTENNSDEMLFLKIILIILMMKMLVKILILKKRKKIKHKVYIVSHYKDKVELYSFLVNY